ncbi:MAG TPA: indolepyruvate oxidoreductase subunit beta [Fermentimonas caenicola]|jgi:indolepyruvate ferredoxin oxidoreductase beta subunit|uniref:Indolepyruvate oxidoreductase subunit beta n=1 Tax=Fermentimonas caenicola TaxID=1562970 RepID=A0A098C0F9_9BACT|nr:MULTISPECIES: indolepyruvate oxidoreductase subunit beta [Lascolabacillus]MBP6176263.1 indolepyruvate oxidoreductase subunit beta [Fermentimonas sp.]MDD4416515.1 indolepyruvate oxidoreductase subunit beta [Proteiniphilum sp.]MDI9625523.1 indolepyruvate oxidoreductase subunit beta [Bacteroidota bacterium]TAH60168.1 MAG: indolepyruvate oxidoreductase subunit beta [Fermentimonas caenicola]MBP6197590.1 indolepyruvate oxidoreductase subunit beta [Fermentimonas sp.]
MQKNIIIAGVGGQGILTIASIIDLAAMNLGLNLKQAEVHGMSQRGGAVESHLRISSKEIYSDLIPLGKADLILSIEPMESLRYLPFLSPEGIIVTTTEPYENIGNYPDIDDLLNNIRMSAKHLLVDAKIIAQEAGGSKTYNIAMLGAASPYLGIETEELEKAIEIFFKRKGDKIVEMNLKAFRLGIEKCKN